MKMYVVGYKQLLEGEPPPYPVNKWENMVVDFSPKKGSWLMTDREWANHELDILAKMRVRVKQHVCHFELEEENGTFAIVCLEHPVPESL